MPATSDERWMRRALRLALRGRGAVSPNPRVGAVIIGADGRLIGAGWHRRYGGPHAEIEALKSCRGADTRGATLVVNLEPCCHWGKTPPCALAVIDAGIKRVVAATIDPNPRVNGGGFRMLREAGVEVEAGVLAEDAQYLNRGYFSLRRRGRAWCAVKVALSLDGRMADHQGRSKWITGPEARRLAHILRADHDAILVGAGTVWHDDPELTVRMVKGPNPVRLILSPHRGIPEGSLIARTADRVPTILVTTRRAGNPEGDVPPIGRLELADMGNGRIDPVELLTELPKLGLCSVMVEGGAGVLSSLIGADVVDEISVGVAASVIGEGVSPFEYFRPSSWETRPRFKAVKTRRYGEDIVITYHRREGLFSQD